MPQKPPVPPKDQPGNRAEICAGGRDVTRVRGALHVKGRKRVSVEEMQEAIEQSAGRE